MKCQSCGREFEVGKRPDGLPNGVSFQLEDGNVIIYCTECIINKGKRRNLTSDILNKYYHREDPDEHMG